MSLADQFTDLARQGADFRKEIYGATAAMDDLPDLTFPCYYSPANQVEMLTPFGIQQDFDLVLRVRKTETNFIPEIGKNVRILGVGPDGSDLVARLVKPRTHALGVEHVFECKNQA